MQSPPIATAAGPRYDDKTRGRRTRWDPRRPASMEVIGLAVRPIT
jgi:hypothetical protein